MVKAFVWTCGLVATTMVLQGCGGDDGTTTTTDSGVTTTPDSGETTTPDSGETTTPDSGETTTPDSGKTTTPDPLDPSGKTTTPDSGKTTTPDSQKTTTAAGSTTTMEHKRSPPMDGKDVAAYLNEHFTGWDIEDKSSTVGVISRMTKEWRFYCDQFDDSGCMNGRARCISSASILNNQVMVKPDGESAIGLQRTTGIVFNTSMVENRLGRCTYQFDGGSLGRLNRGCGTMAANGKGQCENKNSAWYNLDPKTGKECTDQSDAVLKDYCPNRIAAGKEPTTSGEPACFWKGPAFYPKNGFMESESHEMLKQRIRNQNTTVDLMTTWDEVVLDAEMLYEDLVNDPAVVVPAMIYHWSPDARKTKIAKEAANQMALAMQAEFNMSAPVPLVAVDITANVQKDLTKGPFFFGHRPNPTGEDLCCFGQDACDSDISACKGTDDFCGMNTQNCATCSGTWCSATLDDESVFV